MSTTMKLIAKQSLTSTTTTVTFSDIPATFSDLCVLISGRTDRAANQTDVEMRFNGSTSNRSYRTLYGTGAATGSTNANTALYIGPMSSATGTSNTFGNTEIYIPNYAGSTNKSYSVTAADERNAASVVYLFVIAGLWSDTSAITSVSFTPMNSDSFVSGSSFYLYGISKA